MNISSKDRSLKNLSNNKLSIKLDDKEITSINSPITITHFFDNLDLSEEEIEDFIDQSLLIKVLKNKLVNSIKKLEDHNKKWSHVKKERKLSYEKRLQLDKDFKYSKDKILKENVKTSGNYHLCNSIIDEADKYYNDETNCLDANKLYAELVTLEKKYIIVIQNKLKTLDNKRYHIIKDNLLLKKLYKL